MERILRSHTWGCLGLSRDGESHTVPLNYAYVDGHIVIHCALHGQKLDWIRANPRVCFTAASQTGDVSDHPGGKPCHVDSDCVICRGTARIVEDLDERARWLNAFNRAFRPDAKDLTPERVARCATVVIAVSEMTGRRERSKQHTFYGMKERER